MSQFEVIKDISETVKQLLERAYKSTGFTTVTISTDKPKKDNIKNLPTVNCYLYHVSFAPGYRERTPNLVTTFDKEGDIVEFYQDAPLYLYAHLLLNVWGNSPNEENLLLGLGIKTFVEHPMIEGELLKGDSFYPDDQLNLYPHLGKEFNDTLAFWRSMGEEIRPAIYYFIKFRIESERRSAPIKRVTGKDFAIG